MPNVDKHNPGSFSWVELSTTEPEAAKSFYAALFGWHILDHPMPMGVYTIFQIDGRDVAACAGQMPDERELGIPPHWNLYIATANADDSAKLAASLGGKVLAGPFDVIDAGRMAVIQDPTSAVFHLWQPKRNQGLGIAGVPGTLCWAELATGDVESAKKFYESLFHWQIEPSENDSSGYLHIKNGDTFIGGVPPSRFLGPGIPPHWQLYFYVADCDASAAKVKSLGGKIFMEPMSMEKVGRMAVAADPQGASFLLFTPEPRS